MKKIITIVFAAFATLCIAAPASAELTTAAFKAADQKCSRDNPYGTRGECYNKNGFDGVREVQVKRTKHETAPEYFLKLQDGREIKFIRPAKYKAYYDMGYVDFIDNNTHKIFATTGEGEDAETVTFCVSAKDGKVKTCK